MSIKHKTLLGIFWTFTNVFFVKGLSFVAMLFLARWLGPEEFGLIGMISVFIGIGTSLVDSGLSSSIIRTKNANDSDFSTVFYMNIGASILVYFFLFLLAPYIADFYQQGPLINIIRVYCLSFIISAFSAIQLAILTRSMQFKHLTILNIPSTIIGVVVGLFMGYYNYGVWSIVAFYLTKQLILTFLLWITSTWKPSLNFSIERLKYHYKFGYKLMLSGFLDQIFTNSYNILIGRFFPVQMLGYFERAKHLNDYPASTFTGIIGKVTYPMLAALQDDSAKITTTYKRMLKATFFTIAPLMLGAAAIAKPLFEIILGIEWIPAVPFFQILSIASMLYPIHSFNINILKVYGRSDLFLKIEIIKKIITIISICIGFQFGIIGLVWSSVFTSFIALIINTHYTSQFINYKAKEQLLDMLPILGLAIIAFALMYYVVAMLKEYSNGVQLLSSVTIGMLFYLLVHSFFKRSPIYDIFSIIRNRKL